ncbi:MAG: hypothetical protein AAF732_21080 [Pseudomonadota bacterium]
MKAIGSGAPACDVVGLQHHPPDDDRGPAVSCDNWKADLNAAVRGARARISGHGKIEHFWHAKLVTTALAAFGDEQRADFYIEVLPPQGDVPRPDLIVVHPELGCMVIENKGLALKDIVRVDGQQLEVLRNGRSKLEDPFAQSEKVVWRLRDQLTRRVQRAMMFVNTAAMPAVTRSDFEGAFDIKWPTHALFADDLASPDTFAVKLRSIAESTRKRAGKRKVWSPLAAKELRRIINGTSFLFPPRLDHLDDDQGLLGDQIQKLENMDKNPTRLQRDIGTRDLRGAHRLFRGVAGSGKSLMLALNAARTLMELDKGERVLVCCFDKTLVPFLRQNIEDRHACLG